jgi:predicted metal-dependent hydrolase
MLNQRRQGRPEVQGFHPALDAQLNSITIRRMRTKWASCSTEGNLTFNTELLAFESDIADYVIVHELLHLRAPNHGRLWKTLMKAHIGDYGALDVRLRRRHQEMLAASTA